MRWRTEDLLSLRDGEPLDAALRTQLDAQPEARHEVRRLAALREAMRTLPEIEAPTEAWHRIAAGIAAPARARRGRARYVAVAAVATLAVLAAGLWILRLVPAVRDSAPTAAGEVSSSLGGFDPTIPITRDGVVGDYQELVAESARLERVLMQFPRHRGITPASTASTIASLEDQIAWIDALMSENAALDADRRYRRALWEERVTVMNALIDVRYAQTPEHVY